MDYSTNWMTPCTLDKNACLRQYHYHWFYLTWTSFLPLLFCPVPSATITTITASVACEQAHLSGYGITVKDDKEPRIGPILLASSFARDTLPKQVSLFAGYCLRAETDPQKKGLSVITVDGMDEAKTNIPHVTSMSKASSNVPWKKKMPVSHNFSRMKYVYVPDGAVPLPLNAYHRSNLSWTEESDVFCWPLTMETWHQSMCYLTYLFTDLIKVAFC